MGVKDKLENLNINYQKLFKRARSANNQILESRIGVVHYNYIKNIREADNEKEIENVYREFLDKYERLEKLI